MAGDETPIVENSDYLAHILRQGSRTQERADDDLTVDILRYRVTAAGQPQRGIYPTVALVANLSGLVASIGQLGNFDASQPFVAIRESDRIIGITDIPATLDPAVAAGTVQLTDWILLGGYRYRPVPGAVRNDPTTGQSVFVGRLWRR